MKEPFYNLYHIIIDSCQKNKFNINFEFFPNLGENNPQLLEDPNYRYSDLDEKIYQLLKKKIIFHDQEPIFYSKFKNAWQNKIIYLNRLQTNHLLSNSEKNSFEKDELLKISGWHDFYWFSNAFLSLEWYRFYRYASYLENSWNPTKIFSSYNRIFSNREHRLILSGFLFKNFATQSILSCHGNENFNFGSNFNKQHIELMSQVNQKNIFLNTKNVENKNLSYQIDVEDFINSFCHIVTERIFYENRIHLTEKVFRPIVCCRPFILMSSPRSLEYLKGYGFKTFDNFWNEDYDLIEDHAQRIDKILEVINYLGSLSQTQIVNMLMEMKSVLLYNRDHFYNKFQEIITLELFSNLEVALKQQNKINPFFLQFINSLNEKELEHVKNTEIDLDFSKSYDVYEKENLLKILNNNIEKNTENQIREDVKTFSKFLKYQYHCIQSIR